MDKKEIKSLASHAVDKDYFNFNKSFKVLLETKVSEAATAKAKEIMKNKK